ncbi:MAG: hypothetical protein MUF18_09300 [Fimbriiglobus sp.]|jgi:hypothetical protein|nr:hypothetical protein [Fimbriiglobus sp.]
MTALTLAALLALAADPPSAPMAKPLVVTRDAEKDLLERHKQAKPRLPLPPADARAPNSVNNGAMRAYYLPADLRDSGFAREPDPAMTLDNTFKVKLFWIASRTNHCVY